MKNKKKKGFTLIELLAIIVILAIIAVITVPIILNIIENSKKGAATDSAYGYKDAVNKTYIQELAKPNNESLKLDGIYTVQNDGTLVSATGYTFGVTGYNSLPVSLSGDKPSSGSLTYSNNVLTSGCLVIGDYAVTFAGNETSTVKGACPKISYTDNDNSNSLSVGDYVEFVDDNGTTNDTTDDIVNGFNVINPNRNGKAVLMAQYNITNTAGQGEPKTYRQTSGNDYEPTTFSESNYWSESFATSSDCSATYCPLYSSESYAFIYDSNSKLYSSMQNYKTYLEGIIGTGKISRIRPMSYDEAESIISNSWAYNQSYWLGSEDGGGYYVWFVGSDGGLSSGNYDYGLDGVRPVIEISISNF